MASSDEGDVDARARAPRFGFVVAVVAAVLVLQLIAAAVAGILVRRGSDDAVRDALSYVGDATVERTRHFLDPAERAVRDLALMYLRGDAPNSTAALAERIFDSMDGYEQVAAVYVAFPDGTATTVRRLPNGYEVRAIDPVHTVGADLFLHDRNFNMRSYWNDPEHAFDPQSQQWWMDAAMVTDMVWTDAYALEASGVPGVSVASAIVGGDGEVYAVVAADVTLAELSGFLDGLPVGSDGEAFILGEGGGVIAAPARYGETFAFALASGQIGVDPEALGLEIMAREEGFARDMPRFGHEAGFVTLDRGFPSDSPVSWSVHLRATQEGLSPGIRSFQQTNLWYTIAIAILVLAASFLVYQLRHPIGELHARASTDDLTRLANRYEFRRRGQIIVDDAYDRAEPVLVAMFDLDDFKKINDTEGHAAGDRALRAAADALREATGREDVVARFGGDEFVVVRLVGDEAIPYQTVERIRDHVERGINKRRRTGEQRGVTAGFALSGPDYRDLRALAQAADAALVAGKRAGKGQTHGADDFSPRASRHDVRAQF